jgi:hypothetical protein
MKKKSLLILSSLILAGGQLYASITTGVKLNNKTKYKISAAIEWGTATKIVDIAPNLSQFLPSKKGGFRHIFWNVYDNKGKEIGSYRTLNPKTADENKLNEKDKERYAKNKLNFKNDIKERYEYPHEITIKGNGEIYDIREVSGLIPKSNETNVKAFNIIQEGQKTPAVKVEAKKEGKKPEELSAEKKKEDAKLLAQEKLEKEKIKNEKLEKARKIEEQKKEKDRIAAEQKKLEERKKQEEERKKREEAVSEYSKLSDLERSSLSDTEKLEKSIYSILGITEKATDAEIKKAYRTLSMKYHPDTTTEKKEVAENMILKINTANEIFKKKKLKDFYDKYILPYAKK